MKFFKKVKHIHFVGIGGAGMIGIAKVLLKKGYKISGSDISDSRELRKLEKHGAKVSIGHSSKNIKGADLLVISSAISSRNPELVQAKKDSITSIPRAEMLGSIMIGYESIAVAGSHGKTTTTSMIAKILSVANLSPTYVVGGKVLSTDENSDLGKGKYIVAEADESDGSFVHLQPDVAVLTNIDDDHLAHFNNIFENLLDSFVLFSENVPFYGYLIINGDDKNIKKISKRISRSQVTFGESKECDYKIIKIISKNGKQDFQIFDKKRKDWKISLIDTGLDTKTGGRLKRVKHLLGQDTFLMTYGDGLSDIDLSRLIDFHKQHGKMVTVTAVHPGARFGELEMNGDQVSSFQEKPQTRQDWINGGYFVIEPEFFELIENDKTIKTFTVGIQPNIFTKKIKTKNEKIAENIILNYISCT